MEPWETKPEPHYSLWTGCLFNRFYYGWNVKPGQRFWITTEKGLQKLLDKWDLEENPWIWVLKKTT